MKDVHQVRIDRVREAMQLKELDAFLVLIAENRRYLSGFTGEDTQFDESAGALLITAEKLLLATDSRFELQARQEAPDYETIIYREGLAKELPIILKGYQTRRLGFESIRVSRAQHRKMITALKDAHLAVELADTEDIVETLRVEKTQPEIGAIRNALGLAESVFGQVAADIRPGMTEKEAAWSLEKALREAGADGLSFPAIVASGPNSALPHAIPGDRPLRSDEPILFDWGIRLEGYCSDISRTLVMGEPDTTFQKVFQTVREAQEMAIEAIKPGIGTKAVDEIARRHIEKMGFKDCFGHGLGHGVGLAIHEQPRLSPLGDKKLAAGMVCTVEPGIYLPGWGGVRLENMIVVTADGVDVLNRTTVDEVRLGV
ncbi:MAG: aminopeptidase P family protein [Desulfobacterales bacterium]|nr:aminopeptidase P family protein [Desulfobacterales bacterium]